MESFAAVVLVALLAAPIFLGRWTAHRLTSPTRVTLQGRMPAPEYWLPEAVAKAGSTFSSVRWSSEAHDALDDDGRVTGHVGILTGGGSCRVSAYVPAYEPGEVFTKQSPLPAVVTLEAYQYRAQWTYRLVLGKYPDGTAVLARKRVMKQLRKQSRKAARAAARAAG